MRENRVRANGVEFAYLELGEGPLVVLLHGFPDNAWTWEHQMPALAAAGYRAVAPFLRGYAPSEAKSGAWYDAGTLALDVKELIGALNDGRPALLVAQDWGAAIGYGLLAAFPESVARAVLMAVPHPVVSKRSMRSPAQLVRAFHWWFFQLPVLPERVVPLRDYVFLDFLWRYWAPGLRDDAHMLRVKKTLSAPGTLRAAIGYYRALMRPSLRDPALQETRERMTRPITIPTLALCGGDDIRRFPMRGQAEFFTREYEYREIPQSGHFLHREQPEAVNRELLRWMGEV